MTDATQSGKSKPEAADTATEMGVMSVMVPTEVPMASETKQLTTNKTATANSGGMKESMRYATLSALLRPTVPTNIPAAMKMRIMVTIVLSPMPRPMMASLSSKLSLRFWKHATRSATKKITTMGML